jgi:acetyltransferase-like isoleucine patch superfamily enzyme
MQSAGSLRHLASRLARTVREDVANIQPAVLIATAVGRALPDFAFRRLRTGILRAGGWQIGRASVVFGVPAVYGRGKILRRLTIGEESCINVRCMFELNDEVRIGNRVDIGHEVLILTVTHRIGSRDRRAGPTKDGAVTIGDGAWIGARSTILPGVTIGAGAVVAAGSVVNKNVPENSVVAGSPATVVVKRLPG